MGHRFPDQRRTTALLSFDCVEEVLTQCFLLDTLVLVRFRLEPANLELLQTHCHELHTLKFEAVTGISDFALRALLPKLAKLETLSLQGCCVDGLTFDGMCHVLLECVGATRLRRITLQGVKGYTLEKATALAQQLASTFGREFEVL